MTAGTGTSRTWTWTRGAGRRRRAARTTRAAEQRRAAAQRCARRRPRRRAAGRDATRSPGSSVDVPLPHLDRPFDYAVPARWPTRRSPAPGCGCASPAGWSTASSSSGGAGRPSTRDAAPAARGSSSAEPVLTPEVAARSRGRSPTATPARWPTCCGWPCPPRHAAAEARPSPPSRSPPLPARPRPRCVVRVHRRRAALGALAGGRRRAAVWTALPGPDWPRRAGRRWCAAALRRRARRARRRARRPRRRPGRRGADRGLRPGAGTSSCTADLGPAERYRALPRGPPRGRSASCVGTRAAMFAPVRDLGLAVRLGRRRRPARRAARALPARPRGAARCGPAAQGPRCSSAGSRARPRPPGWLRSGWAPRDRRPGDARSGAPLRSGRAGDDAELARDPAARSGPAAARLGLAHARDRRCRRPGAGAGAAPRLPAGAGLRRAAATPARCAHLRRARCGSPAPVAAPRCRWCGRPPDLALPDCGASRFRATVGRRSSHRRGAGPGLPRGPRCAPRPRAARCWLDVSPARPALVVATPGAEPVADGGYAAALLLDGWALLGRAGPAGGRGGAAPLARRGRARPPGGGRRRRGAARRRATRRRCRRWSAGTPPGFADRELAERAAVGLPPAARVAELVGSSADVADLLARTNLPAAAHVLGPVPWSEPASARPPPTRWTTRPGCARWSPCRRRWAACWRESCGQRPACAAHARPAAP